MELPAEERVELGRGLSLAPVDHDEAEMVFNACTPRGHYFFPVRQFGGWDCDLIKCWPSKTHRPASSQRTALQSAWWA